MDNRNEQSNVGDALDVRVAYDTFLKKLEQAENKFNVKSQRVTNVLSFGIPMLALILLIEAVWLIPELHNGVDFFVNYGIESPLFKMLIIWSVTLVLAYLLYTFTIYPSIRRAKYELDKVKGERYKIDLGRLDLFTEELQRLTPITARIFFDQLERYKLAKRWRSQAVDILDNVRRQGASPSNKEYDLGNVEDLISSIEELIYREEKEQSHQAIWRNASISITILYTFALIASVYAVNSLRIPETIPIFSIPLPVVIWSATGSLAGILSRFYKTTERVNLQTELRWLIARPLIGIIMGALVYLALVSGLVLLGVSTSGVTETNPPTGGRAEVYWVIAFLAGFSDRFYAGVINFLIARTVPGTSSLESNQGKAIVVPPKQAQNPAQQLKVK